MQLTLKYESQKEFKTNIPILDIDVSIKNDFKKRHFDFSREYVNEMICSGYEYGTEISKKLFCTECNRRTFKRSIDEIFLSEYGIRQWHESMDGLLTVFNNLGKALRSTSDCNKKLF